MGTRSLFIFKQHIDSKEAHGVYVHYDGYPRGAAEYLENTLNSENTWTDLSVTGNTYCCRWEADEFASGFVATVKPRFTRGGGVRLVNLPHNIGDLDYQYRVCNNASGHLCIDVITFVTRKHGVDHMPVFNGTVHEFLDYYAS
jgi:hypothetical protein